MLITLQKSVKDQYAVKCYNLIVKYGFNKYLVVIFSLANHFASEITSELSHRWRNSLWLLTKHLLKSQQSVFGDFGLCKTMGDDLEIGILQKTDFSLV